MRASRRRAACRADGAYVLPTESQWEYACRAGTTTAYSWGARSPLRMRIITTLSDQTTDVGQYAANPWGFFDMHGNVFEWTADRYANYPVRQPVIDPTGPASGSYRVIRGGSWYITGRTCVRPTATNPRAPAQHHRLPCRFQTSPAG